MTSKDASVRTYADHLRDWENARRAIAAEREYHPDSVRVDAAEALLDAGGFKDSAALRRQTEIVQRIGGIGV